MIKETIDLKLLRYFVVTAETLNFTLASQALNIPKSALSKAIAKLEDGLGGKVFERSSRVVRLTETGHILYSRAIVLLDDASHLLHDLKTMQHSVAGHLKLAAAPALGRFLAQDIIPSFLKQWPEVSISLKLSYEYENLFKEGFDLAFRMGQNRDESVIERPLGLANRVVVAAPDYLAQQTKINHPQDLIDHKSVQIFERQQQVWTLQNGKQTEQVSLNTSFQCADFVALVDAVSGGLGVAQLPWLVVRDAVKSGRLIHILPQWLSSGLPISLVYRDGHNKSAKLAEFLAWIELNKDQFDLRFNGE
ncbi:LysR substrate-binding domain-containing protein [Alteromonadaceae bacterium BrNp21-10]|nr:LysR substrate-binding domain-containing protein [Alteromonadaceae bacterium BrNp21-10]